MSNTAQTKAPPVDLADPDARAEWLAGACEQAADIIAAGLDLAAPPSALQRRREDAAAAEPREHEREGA